MARLLKVKSVKSNGFIVNTTGRIIPTAGIDVYDPSELYTQLEPYITSGVLEVEVLEDIVGDLKDRVELLEAEVFPPAT